jgi:hypothetical protein
MQNAPAVPPGMAATAGGPVPTPTHAPTPNPAPAPAPVVRQDISSAFGDFDAEPTPLPPLHPLGGGAGDMMMTAPAPAPMPVPMPTAHSYAPPSATPAANFTSHGNGSGGFSGSGGSGGTSGGSGQDAVAEEVGVAAEAVRLSARRALEVHERGLDHSAGVLSALQVRKPLCVCVAVCLCVFVCVGVCVLVCVCVCVGVCFCVCWCVRVCVCGLDHSAGVLSALQVRTCTHAHMHPCTHAPMHQCTHVPPYPCIPYYLVHHPLA